MTVCGAASLPKWFTVDEAWLQSCLPGRSGAEWPADNWLRHCHWKVLVLGKRGSGMFFHPDGISTSTYQVRTAQWSALSWGRRPVFHALPYPSPPVSTADHTTPRRCRS